MRNFFIEIKKQSIDTKEINIDSIVFGKGKELNWINNYKSTFFANSDFQNQK